MLSFMKMLFSTSSPCERHLKIAGLWFGACVVLTIIGLFQLRENITPWVAATGVTFAFFVYHMTRSLRCYLKHYPNPHPAHKREDREEDTNEDVGF